MATSSTWIVSKSDNPYPRHGHILEYVCYKKDQRYEEKLLLFWGGNKGIRKDMYSLDLETHRWTPLEPTLKPLSEKMDPRAGAATASYGHQVYIFGGVVESPDGDQVSNEVICFKLVIVL